MGTKGFLVIIVFHSEALFAFHKFVSSKIYNKNDQYSFFFLFFLVGWISVRWYCTKNWCLTWLDGSIQIQSRAGWTSPRPSRIGGAPPRGNPRGKSNERRLLGWWKVNLIPSVRYMFYPIMNDLKFIISAHQKNSAGRDLKCSIGWVWIFKWIHVFLDFVI